MVGWIIFGLILLLLVVLLSLSITFRIQYDDDLTITVGAGKLRYTLVSTSEKGVRKEKKKTNSKAKKKIEKGDIKETVFLVIDVLRSVLPPMHSLWKKVRITALSIDIVVGGKDAAETAVCYGKISALVYGGLATLRSLMRMKVERVAINSDFLKEHIDQKVFFKVKIRILFVIWAGLRMAWRLLVNTFRRSRKNAAYKQEHSYKSPEGGTLKCQPDTGEK